MKKMSLRGKEFLENADKIIKFNFNLTVGFPKKLGVESSAKIHSMVKLKEECNDY